MSFGDDAMLGLLRQMRGSLAGRRELRNRATLVSRPWEEDLMHWARDGDGWHQHGHVSPPADGRRRSITRQGWCPRLSHEALGPEAEH